MRSESSLPDRSLVDLGRSGEAAVGLALRRADDGIVGPPHDELAVKPDDALCPRGRAVVLDDNVRRQRKCERARGHQPACAERRVVGEARTRIRRPPRPERNCR